MKKFFPINVGILEIPEHLQLNELPNSAWTEENHS
jgi:hypothetical protein